jgi:hypothetical protein
LRIKELLYRLSIRKTFGTIHGFGIVLKISVFRYFLLSFLILFAGLSFGASFTSVQNGAWDNPATWGGSTIPAAGDDVTINWGHTVTNSNGSSNVSVNNLINRGSLTFAGNLAVTGALTIEWHTSLSVGGSLSVASGVTNNGTLTVVDNFSITGNYTNSSGLTTLIGGNASVSGLITNNGTMTIEGDVASGNGIYNHSNCFFRVTGNATVTGNVTNNGTFVVIGDMNLTGNLYNHHNVLLVVNGDFTKNGDLTSNGTIVVGQDYVSNGGTTTIFDWGGNVYVIGESQCVGSDCGEIKDFIDWITTNPPPALPYITVNEGDVTFSTSGTFTVPNGVTEITVQVWGGGGKGGTTTGNNTYCGGGGGGAYSRSILSVTAGTSYTYTVGNGSTSTASGGDSWFGSTSTVMAKGGNSVATNTLTGATGGSASSGFGAVKFSGGSGGNGLDNPTRLGGGGGSSAGSAANGNNGAGQTPGAAPTNGGAGGTGASNNGNGLQGLSPGGGGGGAATQNSGGNNGGAGANGQVKITWSIGGCTPPETPTASSNSPICAGSTLTLSTPLVSGATYSWTGPNGFSSSSREPSIANATTAASGIYSVTITVSDCTSAAGTTDVVVGAFPSAPSAVGGQACIGGTATLSASGAVAGQVYRWYNAAGTTLLKTSTDHTDNTFVTPGISATTNFRVAIVSAVGCESSRTLVVADHPLVSPDDQTLAGADSWIGHVYDASDFTLYYGVYTENETFNQIFGGDDVCFPISSSLGSREIRTLTFSVRYRMNSTRKGLYVVDLGSDDRSRLSIDGNLIFNNWVDQAWTSRPRVLISLTGNSSLVYDYYENGGANRVTFQNLTLVLANTLSSNTSQTICLGNSGLAIGGDVFGALPTGVTLSGTGYQWAYSTSPGGTRTGIAGATGATFTPDATIAPFNVPGTYYVYRNAILSSANNIAPNPYVATNESNAATIVIESSVPPTATSNSPICAGETLNLSTPEVSGATYSWTGPNGFSSSLRTPVITNATVAASGTYSVTLTAGGCTSVAGTTLVAVNALPNAMLAVNDATIECGQYGNFTMPVSESGVSYQLYLQDDFTQIGASVSGTGNQISFTVTPYVNTTYHVWATSNSGGCRVRLSDFPTMTVSPILVTVIDDTSDPNSCPDFLEPFNANTDFYNSGSTLVSFKVTRTAAPSSNWGFHFTLPVGAVYAPTGSYQTNIINVNSGPADLLVGVATATINVVQSVSEVTLRFHITNTPGAAQAIQLLVNNLWDINCANPTINVSGTHYISAMPAIGGFN